MSGSNLFGVPQGGGAGAAGNTYLSTGIIEGLGLIGLTGGTTFTIAAGSYQVIDMTNIANITFNQFTVGAGDFVNVPIPNIGPQDLTYVFLDNTGSVFTKNTPPTIADVTNLVYLGNLSHEGGAVLTTDATNLGWTAYNSTLSLTRRDFIEGSKRYFGLEFDFAGNGVSPALSAGETFRLGSNRLVSESDPHRIAIAASVYGSGIPPFTTFSVYSDGGGGITVGPEVGIDFANYDDGSGVLQPVGNNRYANHFFYLFPTDAGGYFLFHEYGKFSYGFLNEAIVGAATEVHFNFLSEAAVIGTISGRNNVSDIDLSIIGGDAFFAGANSVSQLFRFRS